MILGHDEGAAASTGAAKRPDDDRLREECGVFGVFGNEEAAALTALEAREHTAQVVTPGERERRARRKPMWCSTEHRCCG